MGMLPSSFDPSLSISSCSYGHVVSSMYLKRIVISLIDPIFLLSPVSLKAVCPLVMFATAKNRYKLAILTRERKIKKLDNTIQ